MLTLITLGQLALAYEVQTTPDGALLGWDTMPIPFVYAADTAPRGFKGDLDAVEGAFYAWASVPETHISFVQEAQNDPIPENRADAVNVVYWERDWDWDATAVAYTSTWTAEDGALLAFDLQLNAGDDVAWSTDGSEGYDLQSALAHEVGHVLGLDHSDKPNATMYAWHPEQDTSRRKLHWDDEDGARFLYPAIEEEEPPTPLGFLGCSATGTVPSLPVFVVPMLLVPMRRRTARSVA